MGLGAPRTARRPPRTVSLTARGEQTIRALGSSDRAGRHSGGSRLRLPERVAATHPLLDSPRVGHRWPRMVRGRYPELERNHRVGNGGQGRNRTNDTRIFSSSERPVRCEKAEEVERVFDGPTEPTSPTEPIPNPGGRRRSSREVSSRNERASAHRDRAGTEPGSIRPRAGEAGQSGNLAILTVC